MACEREDRDMLERTLVQIIDLPSKILLLHLFDRCGAFTGWERGRPMKDIWDKFLEMLLLCLPLLKAQAASQPEAIAKIEHDREILIQSLEQEDRKTFIDTLKRLMSLAELTARQLFRQI